MAKKRMYSFAKEKHSGKGILSTILGTLSLVIFAVLAWVAFTWAASGCLAWYLPSAVSCSD